jgi:hypothetical protein
MQAYVEVANEADLFQFHEFNFMSLAYRAFKGPFVVSWSVGLNRSEPHRKAAHETRWPIYVPECAGAV